MTAMRRFAPFIIAGLMLGVAPVTGPEVPARVFEYVKPQPPVEVTLVAVGDIMLSRAVAQKMHRHGTDYPFASTTAIVSGADIAFGNLEGPITPGPEVLPFEMRFRADAHVASALKRAGFDILSLANNHMLDFGAAGIADTRDSLDTEGIAYAGAGANASDAGSPAFVTARGITFSFLAYSYTGGAGAASAGTAPLNIGSMVEAVRHAKLLADIVIVSMHAGVEYEPFPEESQIAFARAAIDAGAEMVIGHHPHVVQTLELYKGKYIFYSLGNFVFDQMWSQETREGLLVQATFRKEGVQNVTFHPVLIEDYAQPRPIVGETEIERVLNRLTATP